MNPHNKNTSAHQAEPWQSAIAGAGFLLGHTAIIRQKTGRKDQINKSVSIHRHLSHI
jgi:hypothetical protein